MKKVSILVDTLLNGNRIESSDYYKKLLKATTRATILEYTRRMELKRIDAPCFHGTKLEMIKQIAAAYKGA